MQVVCTDGTTFTCEAYELTDYGVTVYSQPHEPDEDRYAKTPDQMAYVPHDRLWYILPDGVAPRGPAAVGRATNDSPAPPNGAPAPQNPTPGAPVDRAGGVGPNASGGPGPRR